MDARPRSFWINSSGNDIIHEEQLLDGDMDTILKYGIACRKKTCMVRMAPPR